jgi:DNA-directed RNA polymerase specialized sigma24 family protein
MAKRRRAQLPIASGSNSEPHLKCLDECLERLDAKSRELILNYYREQKQAKIKSHKAMGESLKINQGALRARAHRIRAKLHECLMECLQRASESNDIN